MSKVKERGEEEGEIRSEERNHGWTNKSKGENK